jgi:hypothetical protein
LQKKNPKNIATNVTSLVQPAEHVGMEPVSHTTTQVTATNVQSLVQPTEQVGIEADSATKNTATNIPVNYHVTELHYLLKLSIC